MSKIPTIAMIPSAYKANKVYSVLPTNGDADLDFARTSTRTRVNEIGLIEDLATGVPALDYSDGGCPSLLLEPQRTNYWTNSEGADVTLNSPYGSFGFYTLLDSFEQRTITEVGNVNLSFIIKKTDNTLPVLSSTGGSGDFYVMINGSSVKGLNGVLTDIGDGFYEYNLQDTSDGSSVARIASINSSEINVSLIQYELGDYKTSYIPTSGATATRVAETLSKTGLSDYINSSEGTFMVDVSALANGGTNRQISISDGTTTNRVYFGFRPNTNEIIFSSNDSGLIITTVTDVTDYNKIAFRYKVNDFSLWVNGVEVDTDLVGVVPIGLNKLSFNDGTSFSSFYGKIKDLRVYNKALTDTELQTLTS